jgi:hypothetical protein
MGIFDFLRRKPGSRGFGKSIKKILATSQGRFLVASMELEKLTAQVSNLKAVGRHDEAKSAAKAYIVSVAERFAKEDRDSKAMLHLIARAAIKLGEYHAGFAFVESFANLYSEMQRKGEDAGVDLTTAYHDLGILTELMKGPWQDCLLWHEKATEAEPPTGCKEPATSRDKALAHTSAYFCIATAIFEWQNNLHLREAMENRKAWHDQKRREFAPECKWDDEGGYSDWLWKEK